MSGCPYLAAKSFFTRQAAPQQQQQQGDENKEGTANPAPSRCPFSGKVTPDQSQQQPPPPPPQQQQQQHTEQDQKQQAQQGQQPAVSRCPFSGKVAPAGAPSGESSAADGSRGVGGAAAGKADAAGPAEAPKCPLGFSSSRPKVALSSMDCSLCMAFLFQPVQCLPCQHCFCRDCVAPFQDCPACGADIEAQAYELEAQRAVEGFIQEHILKAPSAAAAPPTSAAAAPSTSAAAAPSTSANEEDQTGPTQATPPGPKGRKDMSTASAASSFLFLQAMRAMKRGNVRSAQARLSQCAARLQQEHGELLSALLEASLEASSAVVGRQTGQAPPSAAAERPVSGSESMQGGAGEKYVFDELVKRTQELSEGVARLTLLHLQSATGQPGLPHEPGAASQEGAGEGGRGAATREMGPSALPAGRDSSAATQENDGTPWACLGEPCRGLQASLGCDSSPGSMQQCCQGCQDRLTWHLEQMAGVLSRLGAALGSLADCCAMVGDINGACARYQDAVSLLAAFLLERPTANGSELKADPQATSEKFPLLHPRMAAGPRDEFLSALTVSLNKLGDVRFRQDRLKDALPLYLRALELRHYLLACTPHPPTSGATADPYYAVILDVAVSEAKVADVHEQLGQTSLARAGFAKAQHLAQHLTATPASSTDSRQLRSNQHFAADSADSSGGSELKNGSKSDENEMLQLSRPVAAKIPSVLSFCPIAMLQREHVLAMVTSRLAAL